MRETRPEPVVPDITTDCTPTPTEIAVRSDGGQARTIPSKLSDAPLVPDYS
ncbi:hypothetical protein K0C01_07380 [Salinarchaeum sp. IM2453]|uniref:hypothetical protein n=1 Tax=Salinarchaeum sp. IM2453 TaxID=2862870 RepID=UPI001C829F8F|nr:hypothetical protein [Salinarchaeum sp. IM2453]QZA87632.1 hypothetical protein K0C01_07380 [Salinarchaeum sp. IM2453]